MGWSIMHLIRQHAALQVLLLILCCTTEGTGTAWLRSRYSKTSDITTGWSQRVKDWPGRMSHWHETLNKREQEELDVIQKPIVMGLRHRDHPESPFRPKNATRQQLFEEAAGREEARMVHRRRMQEQIRRRSSGRLDPLGDRETPLPQSDDAFSGRVSPGAHTSEFYIQIAVGVPPSQPQSLLVDTSSHLTWLQCSPCPADTCISATSPLWNPSNSSTYMPILCDDDARVCKHRLPDLTSCVAASVPWKGNLQCAYSLQYPDYHQQGPGATVSGVYGMDNLQLVDANSFVQDVVFGCAHNVTGFTEGAGVLGLGLGEYTLHAQINASLFFCLPSVFTQVSQQGFLGFGSMNLPDGMAFTGMHYQERGGYYVDMTGVSVSSKLLNIDSQLDLTTPGVLIDIGTTFTQLHPNVFNAFAAAINDATTDFMPSARPQPFCYQFDGGIIPDTFPQVAFQFDGGGVLNLTPNQVLIPIPVDDKFDFCLAIQNSTVGYTIIGNAQLAGVLVELNVHTNIVGFAHYDCTAT